MGSVSESVTYPSGGIICLQGEPVGEMYRLVSGTVRVVVVPDAARAVTAARAASEGHTVEFVDEAGEILGEAGAFLEHRWASLIAEGEVTLDIIPVTGAGLTKVIMGRSEIGLWLGRSLARRLREANNGLRLISDYVDGIRSRTDHYCVDFYRICEALRRRGRDDPDLKRLAGEAADAFSFLRGERLSRELAETGEFVRELEHAAGGHVREFAPGEVLCREGEFGGELYVLLWGELEIRIGRRVLDVVAEGEVVGEVAVLMPEAPRRIAEVRSRTRSRVAAIDADDFPALAKAKPRLVAHVVKILSRRLENAGRILADFDRLLADALDDLDGTGECCGADYRRLAESLGRFEDAAGPELARVRRHVEAIADDRRRFDDERSETTRLTGHGVSFGELRGRQIFARVVRTLEAFVRKLRGARPDDSVSLMELAEILDALATYSALGSHAHVEPVRGGSEAYHPAATAAWAVMISDRLELSTDEKRSLVLGCLLHEIGREEELGKLHSLDEAARRVALEAATEEFGPPAGELGPVAEVAHWMDVLAVQGRPAADAARQLMATPGRFDASVLEALAGIVGIS